jgi:hypothetical protein
MPSPSALAAKLRFFSVRLIQLKGGKAGVTPHEIARLKKATSGVEVNWLIAALDGDVLPIAPDRPGMLTTRTNFGR